MSRVSTVTVPAAPVAELEVLVERVHVLDEIPAGPGLATALAGIDEDRLPGLALTFVMQARFRQANHERGELLATIGRILRHGVPGAAIMREPDEFAADEVRGALRLTRRAAKRLCNLAWDLHRRLPAVLDAMRDGRLDQPRGQVFSTWTAGLSREHTDAVVAELLPQAPDLTTGELEAAIARMAIALDPEWVHRRYEAALRNRRVVGKPNPDGTGTLAGHDLPADEVAAACAHLDALARAAKKAGHPDRLDHLRADLLLALVIGRYSGMTDQQIIATLLATAKNRPPTNDKSADDVADEDPADEDSADDEDAATDAEAEPSAEGDPADEEPADDDPADEDHADDEPAADDGAGTDAAANASAADDPANASADDDPAPAGEGSAPMGRSTIGRRGGLRLSAGLLTIAGADQRPADLLGWGPVHAELACDLAHKLGSWWCVLVADGVTQAVVSIRRRPAPPDPTEPRYLGEVWLHTDRDTLRFLEQMARIGLLDPGWRPVIAEISRKLDTASTGPPNGDPTARLPGAALRRWIHIRDGRCTFPGCRAPAHRADTDHTTEHTNGGATVDTGLAAACRHDHRLRHEGGWTVDHSNPGQVTWTSKLGRTYQRHAPPGLLDLPEPRPGAIDERDPEPPPQDPPPGSDPDSCLEAEPQPPPAPILTPEPGQDDDETPPF